MAKTEGKLIANNKKAYHDYFILEKYEAGIVLAGTEVKSLRMGKCSIKESFIRIENGEMYLYGMHISPYEKGNIFNKDPLRVRKLLLHKKEIDKIFGKMKEQGNTVVPLQVYFKGSLVKVEIGLSVGDDIGQIIRNAHKTALLVTHDLSEAVSLADRVIILTKRPASVARIVPITFSLEDDTPMHRRDAPEFKTYFNLIWKELNKND